MHEAAFSQAALPATVRVYGLTLRPYSLAHELWITREQVKINSPEGLLTAVLFCSQSYDQIEAMNRDWILSFKLRLWKWRVRGFDFQEQLAAFMEYQSRGSLEFPDEPPDRKSGRPPGAPFLLRLHQWLILHFGKSEAQAWDYPFGLAKMRYAAWLESEGALHVKNENDIEFDLGYAEYEKQKAVKNA
jgi:hypothetical protein